MKNKKIKILAITLILLAAVCPSSVYAYNTYNHNKFFNEGQANIDKEEYNKAIDAFSAALKYKKNNSEEINKQIKLAENLKTSKTIYEDGLKKFNDKNYLEAISAFEKIKKEDIKRYNLSQGKIVESKKLYTNENIAKAQKEAASKKYTEAMKYLDLVLKIDSKNEQALKLKNEYNKEIQLEKELAEKTKREQQLQENTKASDKTSNTNSQSSNTTSGKYKIVLIKNGFNVYKTDGTSSSYQIRLGIDAQWHQLLFTVFGAGNTYTPDCNYKIIFHLKEGDIEYNGKTSPERKFIRISTSNYDTNVVADVYLTYKGEIIKFTRSIFYKDPRK